VRLRRLRFTLKQMMIGVAVAAGLLATGCNLYLAGIEDALDHENRGYEQALMATPTGKVCESYEVPTPRSEHHAHLKRTYELAAVIHWIAVAFLVSLPLCARVFGRILGRFQVSLGSLMGAVAIFAVLLGMFVPTARMRIDWQDPRIDDVVVAAILMLAEAVLVYYAVLATVIVRGLVSPARRAGRVRRVFIYGPLLALIALGALLQVIDALGVGR
jgi:hypothetical protein